MRLQKNITYLFLLTILMLGCTHLFYYPDSYLYSDPVKEGYKVETLTFYADDGIKLTAWLLSNKENIHSQNLVVLFHGNAQNLSSHYKSLDWIIKYGHDLLVFDYRGYGISEGKPSQQAISKDMALMLDEVEELQTKGGYKKLILVGQSLGGTILLDGLANKLAEEDSTFRPNLLVIDSSFLSYKRLAVSKLKSSWMTWIFSPLGFLFVSDKNAPLHHIDSLLFPPTLVIHGTNDAVVPQPFGQEIFRKIGTHAKLFWNVQDGRHIDAFNRPQYREKFLDYLNRGDFSALDEQRNVH